MSLRNVIAGHLDNENVWKRLGQYIIDIPNMLINYFEVVLSRSKSIYLTCILI